MLDEVRRERPELTHEEVVAVAAERIEDDPEHAADPRRDRANAGEAARERSAARRRPVRCREHERWTMASSSAAGPRLVPGR